MHGRSPTGRLAAGPLWRKAPFAFLHYPDYFLGVGIAALLLSLAVGAGVFFLASAETAALHLHIDRLPSGLDAFRVAQYGRVAGADLAESVRTRDGALDERLGRLEGLRPRLLTTLGAVVDLGLPTGSGRKWPVRPMTRTGALDHVRAVSGQEGDGIWVPDYVAKDLQLSPGDQVELTLNARSVRVEVSGIYETLLFQQPSPYWQTLIQYIYAPVDDDDPLVADPSASRGPAEGLAQDVSAVPPQFVITSPALLYHLEDTLRDNGPLTRWEYPIVKSGLTLDRARGLVERLNQVQHDFGDPQSLLRQAFSNPDHFTALPDAVEDADETVLGIRSPINLLSFAGVLVAFAMIGSAGLYGLRRRRAEMSLLSTRGLTPVALALRSTLEALPVVVVGAVAGLVISHMLVSALGPSNTFGRQAMPSATRAVLVAQLIALGLLAVVSGRPADSRWEGSGRLTQIARRFPWEAIVLFIAAITFYELATRDVLRARGTDNPVQIDVSLILFPLLLMAGGAGGLVRLWGAMLPRLRRLGASWPTASYLASRRLATGSRLVFTLTTASTLAVAILLYSSTLVDSIDATATAKAQVAVGSDFSTTLMTGAILPDDLHFPWTIVRRLDSVQIGASEVPGTLLIVEPQSFEETAFWDPAFSDESLTSLLARLADSSGSRVPAVIAGGGGERGQLLDLEVFTTTIRTEIASAVTAWPGMSRETPTVVVAREPLERSLRANGETLAGVGVTTELWANGDADQINRELEGAGVGMSFIATAEQAKETPGVLATTWTFAYLRAIGIATGLIVVAGILLYIQSRQHAATVSWALAFRMGLGAGTNRLAAAYELMFILISSLVLGALLALISVELTYRRFDLSPEFPPPPLFRYPVFTLTGTALALLCAVTVGAWRMQRAAANANVAEALRLAD